MAQTIFKRETRRMNRDIVLAHNSVLVINSTFFQRRILRRVSQRVSVSVCDTRCASHFGLEPSPSLIPIKRLRIPCVALLGKNNQSNNNNNNNCKHVALYSEYVFFQSSRLKMMSNSLLFLHFSATFEPDQVSFSSPEECLWSTVNPSYLQSSQYSAFPY